MNITEDFCSYEVAKLLKEKGFDESCIRHWDCDDHSLYGYNDIPISNSELQANEYNGYAAPTLQMAMKWLREEKDVYICVIPRTNYNTLTYEYSIWYYTACERKVNWGEGINLITEKEFCCPTWEEAVESVVKYSLENLI